MDMAPSPQVRLSLHINRLEHLPPELGNLVHLEALRWVPGRLF